MGYILVFIVSLNFALRPFLLNALPLIDFVGIVLSCGERAEERNIQPGDRVSAFVFSGGNALFALFKHGENAKNF